ncbi:MAG: ATP-binding protein [Rhodomicrobiaceae bacterium]
MQSSMTAWLKQYFSHRPLSVKRALLIIILLAALPPIIFSAVLLIRYAASERIIAERTLVESAEAVARAIDAEFMAVEAVLQALASSTRLQADDLQGFGNQIRAVSARTGRDFALVDAQGQTIIATSPEMNRDIFRSPDETVFTNVLPKPEGEFAAYVIIPFKRKNGDVWFLEGSVKNADFRDILAEPGVPSDWVVSIVDRTGTHLIRSHGSERFAGKPLVEPLVAQIKRRQRGILETVSLEGIPLISTVAFARTSGWAAAIGLPRANLAAPLREQLTSLVLLAVPLTALALIAGVMLAGLLNGAMDALKIMAAKVGRDGNTGFAPTLIHDANEVGDVMAQTSAELHRRREELAALNATLEERVMARTAELTEANKRLENEIRLPESSEAQLRQMQKMEAVGQLTGGIAHDFNNMLAVILSGLHLIRRRLKRGNAEIEPLLDGAVHGAERAAALVSRLLAFSRQQPLSPEPVEVNRLLSGLEDMLRRTIPENIAMEMVLAGGLWQTLADVHGLENTLVNLAVNARDAMPEGGKLTFETANAFLDEAYATEHPEVASGQYVMIAVTDMGEGMPPDVLDRVFEPFYTTKPTGAGTGLGLSQVYGFIKQSGGHVKIYSEPGVGTSVKLYLPRHQAANSAHQNPPRKTPPAVARRGDRELILIVEDDPDVRRVTVEMLEELNYATLQAEDGADALRLIENTPDIALLLTDVVMPKMNGRALADATAQIRPDLKVLFTTGYTRNAIIHNGVLDEGVNLLIKPYNIDDLSRKLHELFRDADLDISNSS